HQLLRFLATDPENPARLQLWAGKELQRIDFQFEQHTKEVQAQHEAIAAAKDVSELRLAEAKLKALTAREGAAKGQAVKPDVSIEAIRAGFFSNDNLGELNFPGARLDGVSLTYCKMAGSNFENSDFRGAKLYSSDLRMCNFSGADLKDADLSPSDCRGAKFIGADLQRTNVE